MTFILFCEKYYISVITGWIGKSLILEKNIELVLLVGLDCKVQIAKVLNEVFMYEIRPEI